MKIEDKGEQNISQILSPAEYYAYLEQDQPSAAGLGLLNKFLSDMLPKDGGPTRNQVRSILEVVAQPTRLSRVLTSVLSDPNQAEALALRSYGHSTGMERIQLAAAGPYSLRLHFWMPARDEVIPEDPHNHVYQFGAKVLSGILVTDLYARGGEGEQMNMYEIASQTTLVKPKPEQIGVARLVHMTPPGGIVLTSQDHAYTMSETVIHSVTHGDSRQPVITLNLRGPTVRDRSTFFRDETMPTANPTPTPVDIVSRLGSLLHQISQE